MALPELDVDPAEVEALAAELGLGKPSAEDVEPLGKLLDDDFELLDAPVQAKLRQRLSGKAGVTVCGACGNVTLARYRAARCRTCGARTGGEDAVEAAKRELFADPEGPQWARIEQPDGQPAGGFSLAKGRALLRVIELGEDNEDWEVRGERLRQEAEEVERKKADEVARRKADEERKKKEAAEAEARKKAAEEERRRAEAARKAAEEQQRKAAEEAARKEREAEEAAARAVAEEEERRVKERRRPSFGALFGRRAGALVRIDDAPAKVSPAKDTQVFLHDEKTARLYVPSGKKEKVNGKERSGFVDLTLGEVVTVNDEVFVYDERNELENASPPSVHFTRKDNKPGGPFPYYNEPSTIGADRTCQINLQDDGVEDEHARLFTRFGRLVIEDASGIKGGGVEVNGQRVPWALLDAGAAIKVGPPSMKDLPELAVAAGAAELKPKGGKAAAMKPSRHARTLLEVKDEKDQVVRRVFLFTRREVRFGSVGRGKDGKMLNELVLVPAPGEEADVSEKQGGLGLAREGVELRRDGACEMLFDGESMPKGRARMLKGGFELILGEDLTIEGRAFRSGSLAADAKGPAQLGIKGGHPVECIRLDRVNCPHTYVFLVRMLRIGSEASAPLRLELPGVQEGHAQLILNDGKMQVVATRKNAKVHLGDVELEQGVPTNLAIDTEIRIGNARIFFREAEDGDFTP